MPDGSHGIYPKPRVVGVDDIANVVDYYRIAAINAIEAGFLFVFRVYFCSLLVLKRCSANYAMCCVGTITHMFNLKI